MDGKAVTKATTDVDANAEREMTRMGQRIGYLTKSAARAGGGVRAIKNQRPTLPRKGGAR